MAAAQVSTLLVLAAGMGSRYGDLKQIDPVGPHGETLLDYVLYDALTVGFRKIVFVIRRSFALAFKDRMATTVGARVECTYAYQELDVCLGDAALAQGRTKPWGTGHAILMARDAIDEPFVVINADDFYGRETLHALRTRWEPGTGDYVLAGFRLNRTLSEHGQVCRGICRYDDSGTLTGITEFTRIAWQGNRIVGQNERGITHDLAGAAVTSMNAWGFTPDLFSHLDVQFQVFLTQHGHEANAEFYIPTVVDRLVRRGAKRVRVLPVDADWFGVTYREDKARVQQRLHALIEQGLYPENLWGECRSLR